MPFTTPHDPRAAMRGRTFHGAVATVILTRGWGMPGAAWALHDTYAADFFDNAPGATKVAKDALFRVLADMPRATTGARWSGGGGGAVSGVWVRHYDGPGTVEAALDALADEGIWYWYAVVLDDAPAEAPPAVCEPAPLWVFHPGVGVCTTSGRAFVGPDAAWPSAGDCAPHSDPRSVPCAWWAGWACVAVGG